MSERRRSISPFRRRRHDTDSSSSTDSTSASSSPRRRGRDRRRSHVTISPLRLKRSRRAYSPSTPPRRVRLRSRSPSWGTPRPALPPRMEPTHTVTSAMLEGEEDCLSQRSSSPLAFASHRDVILQAWDVISRRAQGLEQQVDDVSSFSLNVPLGRVGASSATSSRPCGSTMSHLLDLCSDVPRNPAALEAGLVSCSTLNPNLRLYAPTSGNLNFASARPSTVPPLNVTAQKFELSLNQFRHFVTKGDNLLAVSNFVQLLSDALAVLSDLECWDETAMADVQCLSSALSLVSRDLCALSAATAVSFRLIQRDAILAKSALPDSFRSDCRHTTIQSKRLFGAEAEQVVKDYQSSPAVLLDTALQKQSSRTQAAQSKKRKSYQPTQRKWRKDPRQNRRRPSQRSAQQQRKSVNPSAAVPKQSS